MLETERSGRVEVLIRPESLTLAAESAAPDRVELVEYYGHDTVSLVRLSAGELLRVRTPGPPVFERGARVSIRHDGRPAIAFARP